MIVVSDTTPLRHLIAIGQVDLLRKLYSTVTVPTAVWNELQAESTPEFIKSWLENAPDWLAVRSPGKADPGDLRLETLDPGEQEAIQLAVEFNADLLLMDDREGRELALRLQLPVTGTLGVLERADLVGLLPNFPAVVANLEGSGFYLSARLREAILQRYRSRHGTRSS